MGKPWKTKAWKEKRSLFLKGKICEWCGSNECLCISHKEMDNRGQIKYQVFGEFLNNYLNDKKNINEIDELKRKAWEGVTPEYMNICPTCKKSCYKRSDKFCKETGKPKFRCSYCNKEFEESIKRINNDIINEVKKRFFQLFRIKYGEEITKISSEKIQQSEEKYTSFENVMVQCRRCHFAYHKGWKLCKKCKKNYHTLRYITCRECNSEKEVKNE